MSAIVALRVVGSFVALAVAGCSSQSAPERSAAPPSTVAAESEGWSLPAPGGPYPVGTSIHHWADDSRAELGSSNAEDRRELVVQLWYPAEVGGAAARYPFFPDLAAFQTRFGAEAYPDSLGAVRSNSTLGAAVLPGDRWPVVVFFHGWNSRRSVSTGLMEALASRGFVTVGVDQPFAGRVALPDGQVTDSRDDFFSGPMEMLDYYGRDYFLVIERLAELTKSESPVAGRLRLEGIGVMGHSNGAISAAQASRIDPRVAAVALLDSFDSDVEELYLLERPVLLVRTGGAQEPSEQYWARISEVVYDLEIHGGSHLTATDLPYVQATGDEERQQAAIASELLDTAAGVFFGRYLRESAVEIQAPTGTESVRAVLHTHRPES